ncbi:CMRF35-like molecule 5 isoform X2 [Dicentrarchus labrax]|uniref:CMRF35-like molecule 5 isoform X2 n=1 Tax=Dicentrarchus labrax TaxID=13489 RepID=UPI0021F5F87B|nr:CMRF35-like molecule 5 isoform X2 [Dicentrarchus labrax]
MMYVYSCLLCALSVVAVEPLNLNGHVGKNVTFKCSDWNVWAGVKSNVKYLCDNPCSENKHIIIKAEYGKTAHENRIELTNRAEGLFVTFTNLQKSDSKKYYCGVERFGPDPLIEVNLKVIDESPKNTPATFAVTSSSTVSSSSSDSISAMSTSYIIHCTTTTAPATQRSGSVPFMIVGVILILTLLIALLYLMRKMAKKQLDASRADTPQEDMREEVEYDKIRPEDQQTACQPAGVSTLSFSADPDSLYANYSSHQGTELAFSRVTFHQCDLVYSVIPLPSDQSEPNQSESNTNDSLYSMAQLPQAT